MGNDGQCDAEQRKTNTINTRGKQSKKGTPGNTAGNRTQNKAEHNSHRQDTIKVKQEVQKNTDSETQTGYRQQQE